MRVHATQHQRGTQDTGAVTHTHTCVLGMGRLCLLQRVVVLAVHLHSPQAMHEHPEGGPAIAVNVHAAQQGVLQGGESSASSTSREYQRQGTSWERPTHLEDS